jgi:NO-binding membrane sensor protein with MHYT domain
MMLPESYDPVLVALSYVVALLGSYAALSIVGRLTDASGRLRVGWLVGGAFAQGFGIWGMHFTGMLALRLPVPVAYNVALVTLSFLVAMSGSLLSLWLTRRPKLRRAAMVAGGISIGTAIAGLHFIDMAAMRMPARTSYHPLLVIASVIVAVVFGLVGLWIGRRYQRDDPRRSLVGKWGAALIVAIAIVGQHYTGMAAAMFHSAPQPRHWINGPALPSSDLPEAVLLATFLILATGIYGVAVDRRRSARARISRRLLDAQENERRRISHVLHEDVGQLLTAVRMNLERLTLPYRDEGAVVGDSISLVDEALMRVRSLSVELRPTLLDNLGLAEAVKWYAERQAERAGYAVVIDLPLGRDRLPEVVETAGFRIVQQALTNIARHARARTVHVELRREPQGVEILVRDDGIGFDARGARMRSRAGESLGLVDMAEMAQMAGGSLTITSSEGEGSTVRVRLPVDSPG